ncbi:FAD-binding domain-containing protein [Mycena floridula]|nr:FAD-binding domain-containing protein [Mycena floridula]
MKSAFLSSHLLVLGYLALVHGTHWAPGGGALRACHLLQAALPGQVFFPGSLEYAADVSHFESSSSQNSTCSVEPVSAVDISTILKIIGRDDIRAPFAVKSGGHSTNIGFSSTLGVQISMTKFTNVIYDGAAQTVAIGPGLTWDQVYAQLEQFKVTVVGGRVPGVGVGLLLGGGYSWVTNQYGLGIDNIVALDLVLPNGTFVQVTETSQPDLFFGLKGGFNNFGIVTTSLLRARPLSSIWGGVIFYSSDQKDAVSQALSKFSLNNVDTKAQLAAAYVVSSGQPIWQVVLFYAEGTQAPSVYQPFLDIPSISSNIVTSGSFSEFVASISVIPTDANSKGISDVVPIIQYTPPIIEFIQTQTDQTFAQGIADNRSLVSVLLGVEPFLDAFAHSTPSAYPHSRARPVTPCNLWVTWSDPKDTEYAHATLRKLSDKIQAFAIQEGQSMATDLHYPNYALDDTPLNLLYGNNVHRLKQIKQHVDPKNIMGLTGGFQF